VFGCGHCVCPVEGNQVRIKFRPFECRRARLID
jgi:endogenous inhibitor of DNA gyrase (YacG/DUF329 family)